MSYLGILGQNEKALNLHAVFPWIFKICISFCKRFLLDLFIMLYVMLLRSEIKFATSKTATLKMYLF